MKKSNPLLIVMVMAIPMIGKAQLWKAYADTAKSFQDQRNNNKAIEYLLLSIDELKKDSAGSITHANYNDRLAFIYFGMARYDKAEPLFLETKELREKLRGKESAGYAAGCNNLALLYANKGKYDKAETLNIEAKDIRARVLGKENADYATSCNNLGLVYRSIGRFEEAEPLLIEAKQVREKIFGKQHADYAASCSNLGILYFSMGLYNKAEALYLEALAVREKLFGKENPQYASSLNNLAIFYRNTGQFDKAEAYYLESKGIRERTLGKEHPDYAASCGNLAVLYWAKGEFDKVETLHLEAMRVWEKVYGKLHPEYARTCNNLATFYKDIGLFEKAEPIYLEGLQIREQIFGKKNPEYAETALNIGILYQVMEQYAKAEPFLQQAKETYGNALGKDHPLYANSCRSLAILYAKMEQYDKAEPLFAESLAICKEKLGEDDPEYENACANMASLYQETGKNEEAKSLFLQSGKILISLYGKRYSEYAVNCTNLAGVYWNSNQTDSAYYYYAEALESRKNNLQDVFQFTSEKEKSAYLKTLSDIEPKISSFSIAAYPHERQGYLYDLYMTNRQLVLSSSKQLRDIINNSGDTSLYRQYNEWIDKKERLAFWLSKPDDVRNGMDSILQDECNSLEQELTRRSVAFAKQEQTMNWNTIQASLKTGEAAIEFSSFQFCNGKRWVDSIFYVAVVLRKDGKEPELIKLFEERLLDSVLSKKNSGAGAVRINTIYSGKKNIAGTENLYDLIWKPLEKELAGIHTIYFAPAGLLHKISFAALPVNATEVLSDQYKLFEMNSTASVTGGGAIMGVTKGDNISLYGGIQYDADSASISHVAIDFARRGDASRSLPEELKRDAIPEFYYLAGSEKESQAIGEMAVKNNFSTTALDGIRATEESFKALSGKNSPAVLHIATHGFFFPDPRTIKKNNLNRSAAVFRQSDDPLMRSGLAMAGANNAWKGKPVPGVEDGILTAYEVSNMYLPNTKLVVLSACETGLGDIQGSEGVYGLQRAFKMAGVQNLVMSLWKVPDAETAEFMQLFYKNLFAKQTIADAFQNAQAIMKNKYRMEPFKWAAWILVR